MIKLVISDMDGTLIDKDEVLSDKAINIARRLHDQGILFTIATGRVESMAEDYVKRLGIKIPYVACNGVTIVQGDKVLQRNTVPLKGLRPIVEKADSMGMSLVYSIDGLEYVYKVTPWIERQRVQFDRYHRVRLPGEQEWESLLIDKLMVMDDVREGAIAILEAMCMELPEAYGFTRYTNKSVEIVSRKSTKASALKTLVEFLDIDMSQVLAIGDHQNDIEMIREAGIGAAVSNATDGLKKEADYVASGKCVVGVEEIVERFCALEPVVKSESMPIFNRRSL